MFSGANAWVHTTQCEDKTINKQKTNKQTNKTHATQKAKKMTNIGNFVNIE
jgi:hypothetical protein